jgi:hypothetical protein
VASDYQKILESNLWEYGHGCRHKELLYRQLYPDKTHFIFELLQNAEDAGATKVRFRLQSDRLEIQHDGRLFDERDVRGICGIGEGTKPGDLTQIGTFGIGFKSVWSYTAGPEIHSGEEHFRIERLVEPIGIEPRGPEDGCTTLFVIPFSGQGNERDRALKEISRRLGSLDPRTLLFLRSIRDVHWAGDSSPSGFLERKEKLLASGARVVRLCDGAHSQGWLVFDRPVPIPERFRRPSRPESIFVEAAFRVSAEHGDGQIASLGAIQDSRLVVFFETQKETHLGFLIQGAYKTTLGRDNVPEDDPWNRQLVQETALLIAQTLPRLRDLGLLTVGVLEAMPIDPSDFPEDGMLRPVFERVRETVREHALLPAQGGGFVAGKHAKLAESADLRALLSPRQLRQLFGAASQSKWLSGDVTGDLRTYLVRQLAVGEVTAYGLARSFDERFIQAQSDEWVAKFYGFLSKRDVWEKGGPLCDKPFIRLEDDRHVAPFQDDGSPNAYLPPDDQTDYPIVKRVIAENKKACQFLTNLGLTEPDIVDEVIKSVLPRYDGTAILSPNQHDADLRKIFSALETDSQTKRKRLLKQLEPTPFARASNAMTGATKFCKPGELYRRTDELELYFAGDTDAWFLDEPAFEKREFEDVWEVLHVERVPRLQEFQPKLSRKQIADLQTRLGYSGRIDAQDRDLHGLRPFLRRIDEADESLRPQMACVLWTFLVRHLESSGSHSLFFGRYSWFYYKARGESFDARLARRLRNAAWLPDHGTFKRPCEVSLDDLPDNFERDSQLAEALHMRAAVSTALAREIGVAPDDIEYLRTYPFGDRR